MPDISVETFTQPFAPRLVVREIEFSGGQTLKIEENETVVFVGPNNAGKSACLREIPTCFARSRQPKVISNLVFDRVGSNEDFRNFLNNKAILSDGTNPSYSGLGYSFSTSHVNFFEDDIENFRFIRSFFINQIETTTRIGSADKAGAIRLYQEPPSHPIHLLMQDSELEKEFSDLFKRAYDKELFVFRAGGSEFPLYVGTKPQISGDSDALSKEFVDKAIANAQPLAQQGDGMRSFCTVLLFALLSTHHSILTLDEPEAFLHPPQARLLGEYLSQKRKSNSQLFVATHSSAIIEGLCASSQHNVRIVRIIRIGDKNFVHEIEPETARKISHDPTARFSRVLEGLFYKNVVITESDSDSLFYNALLNIDDESGGKNSDILFLHGAGKSRISEMVGLLRSANVNTYSIVDIDIIRETSMFKKLFEAFGGDWGEIASAVSRVQKHVTDKRPPLTVSQVRSQIETAMDACQQDSAFTNANRASLQSILKQTSSWDFVKTAGKNAFNGSVAADFALISEKASEKGVWIVPVGEIEGFCRTASSNHGPAFVQDVLENRDLLNDPELEEARQFMKSIGKSLA